MTTDFRALCIELVDIITARVDPDDCAVGYVAGVLTRARAALAEAVPEPERAINWPAYFVRLATVQEQELKAALADEPAAGEPAAVTGQPSDDNCWQWYTYCPEEGLEMYSDRKEAQSAAQSIMGSYKVAAHSDGWHEDMESVSWGMLVPVEQAQVIERKTAEPGGEFDEWVKYELRPARYGHQPAPPADGKVAELVAALGSRDRWMQLTDAQVDRAADLLQRLSPPQPVPVSERLPEPNTKVLAHYFNALGKGRTICAIWVPAKTQTDSYGEDDFTEYDEETDNFYWPEGWYEAIENWDDLGWVKVNEGKVVYWQPLPKWPAHALPLPEVSQ